MKRPTLVAVSSMVAMAVPMVSEKMTTSDMRKDIIRANVADIQQDVKNDVPTLDTPNPEKMAEAASDNPDLITVTLTQDGTGTQIVNKKTQTPEQNQQISPSAPQQEPADIQKSPINNPERVQISKSEIITLRTNDLSFHKNSVDVRKEAYPVLRDIKDYIERNDFLVSIIGYTDTSGASSYNKRLSLRRAEKVSSKLIELGLSKDNPIRTNDTEEGREGNRRVEFRFVKKGQV